MAIQTLGQVGHFDFTWGAVYTVKGKILPFFPSPPSSNSHTVLSVNNFWLSYDSPSLAYLLSRQPLSIHFTFCIQQLLYLVMKSHKLVIINLQHWSDTDTNIVKVNCFICRGSIWIYESIDWIFNCRHCTFKGGLFKSLVLNVTWVGVCFILITILSTTKTSIDIKNLIQLRLSCAISRVLARSLVL